MNIFKLLISVLLIASFGCDSDGTSFGGNGTVDPNKVCKDPAGEIISCKDGYAIGPITVTGKSPDGLPGTFYVEKGCSSEPWKYFQEHTFANVASFEVKIDDWRIGDYNCVQFTRDKHLFVPYGFEIKDSDKDATFNFDWSAPYSWGLAPNGIYVDDVDDKNYEVETYVEDQKIFIYLGFSFGAPLNIDTFDGEDENDGEKLKGTVADDLQTITFHSVYPSGKKYEGTLTKK